MKTLLYVVHLALCVVLIAIVMVQHRKAGGFGGIFGGGTMADMGGGQWKKLPFLTKITVIIVALFMISSVLLSVGID